LLGSGLTLPLGRLLFEIAHCGPGEATPGSLASRLALDAGYVSRLLTALEGRGLIERRASASDGRSTELSMSAAGRAKFAEIDARSRAEVAALVGPLSNASQKRVVEAMRAIELGFEGSRPKSDLVATLRHPRPGD